MRLIRSESDQIDTAAKHAQVRTADAAEQQARVSIDALKAAQAAAEASRDTARWTFWIAIVMAVSVLADILIRIF